MRKSPFQRQIDRDFSNTFLNFREFGRICDWNGGKLQITEAARDSVLSEEAIGILHNTKRVYCRSGDLTHLPRPNDLVMLDGVRWRVVDSQQLMGHFEILLERFSDG